MIDTVHQLDETAQSLRQAVRAFAEAEIAPLAAQIDRDDHLPRTLWPRLGELGVLGITAEARVRRIGLGYLHHVIAAEEISRASGSVGIAYIAHSNLHVNQLRPEWQCGAEGTLSARAGAWRTGRRAGHEASGRRLRTWSA